MNNEYDTTPKQATECSNMTSTASITCLPRYTLSVILSYLQPPDPAAISNGKFTTENDNFNYKYHHDGVALLLTTKQLTSSILPLFRVPKRLCRIYKYPAPQCAVENEKSNNTKDVPTINKTIVIVEKYRFMVLPIQDPRTLLDRLNTRRLKQRVSWIKGLQSEQCEEEANKQVQSREGNLQDIHHNGQEVTLGDTSGNFNTSIENACNNDNSTGDKRLSNEISYYQKGRTIEELALEEWAMMEIHHGDGTLCGHKNCMADNNTKWRVWPAHLELLRFLDDINFKYDDGFEGSEDKNMFVNAKTKSKLLSSLSLKSKPSGSGNSQGITDSMSGVNSLGRDTFGEGVTLLASYPRSGNTLLRTLLERITSIVTGSDTRPDRTLSRSKLDYVQAVSFLLPSFGSCLHHQTHVFCKTTNLFFCVH